jgi:hypothetical protein
MKQELEMANVCVDRVAALRRRHSREIEVERSPAYEASVVDSSALEQFIGHKPWVNASFGQTRTFPKRLISPGLQLQFTTSPNDSFALILEEGENFG